MINQEPIYRLVDLDEDGSQYLTRTEVIPLGSVDISQEDNGEITFTPKQIEAPDTGNGKYRLVPEGDMFRVYATRRIRDNVNEGDRGGLVGSDRVLSERGTCWISDGSKAHEGVRIKDDALVTSSCDISGDVTIGGHARLSYTVVAGDCVMIEGSADINDSRISNSGDDGGLIIRGCSHIHNSVIEPAGEMLISGCNINSAHVRNRYELLSAHSNLWGWLSACRNTVGGWQFTVGCKTRHSAAAVKELAEDNGVSQLELEMLDHFLAMVEVSRRGWVDYVPPAPAEDPKSDTAPHGGTGEVPVSAFVADTQTTEAQLLRDATWAANRPDHDQYGAEL